MRADNAASEDAAAVLPREPLTLRRALRQSAARLTEAGIESAAIDGEALLRHLLGLERAAFYLRLDDPLGFGADQQLRRLIERRAAREPLAYITGRKEFWSLDFFVTPAVLIPRPETELLVELALEAARDSVRGPGLKILDMGTGSGAIAVTLAKQLPASQVWAVDISAEALRVAAVNAEQHGVHDRVRFFKGDLFDALDDTTNRFDLVISNPPYIRSAELSGLAPEIRDWEPSPALDGGTDGLDYYRRIIHTAPRYLADGGSMLLENGADMAGALVDFFGRTGCFASVSIHQDYAGRDRVVSGVKGSRRG